MTNAVLSPPTSTPSDNHAVLFYDDEETLYGSVAGFIETGLAAGDPAVVVATEEHRKAFVDVLGRSLDIERMLQSGLLTMLDAREVLDAFMGDDGPDGERFDAVLGGLLARIHAERPGKQPRVYGEMVEVLCRKGEPDAAIALEVLWNDLARRHSFSLFCAYTMNAFHRDEDATMFARVCDAHSDVLPDSETHARMRTIGDLQRHTRKLEADLERSREADAFRLLVETVRDYAIFMLDPTGCVRTWNAGAERLKGYTATEIIGRHFSCFYPADEVQAGKCERELEIATAEGRFEEEGWRYRKDGSPFWANVVITALHDPTGTLVGFAKVTRDLTERRNAEEERLRLARYQEASRVRDEFIATISHELRTPLNAILGWATMLSSQETDPQTAKAVSIIARNARTQARLIDDLLDVSRIITGKLRLELGPVNLETAVREALEVVRPAADARGVKLVFERATEISPLIGDAARLQQVAWNLLSNAVKFTEEGGVVTARIDQEGSSLALSVRDTGRGIDPTFIPYVFDRFRQAEGSTRRSGGLGLGLSIVRHIVELHGGKARARSAGIGQGATFTVTLPVRALAVADEPVPSEGEGAEHSTRLDGLSILVVDDEVDARELLVAMLEKRGATVTSARSAIDARMRLETFVPDVIVCDVGMPGEDGYQFVKSLRSREGVRGSELPVIALTGYASARDRRRAFAAGFNNHVPKPVHPEELASAIQNVASFTRR